MFATLPTSWFARFSYDIVKYLLNKGISSSQNIQQVLTKYGFKQLDDTFESIYIHTLVEYSIDKDKGLIALFGLKQVSNLFKAELYDNQLSNTTDFVEKLLKILGYNASTKEVLTTLFQHKSTVDFQQEAILFIAIFDSYVTQSQSPVMLRMSKYLKEIIKIITQNLPKKTYPKYLSTFAKFNNKNFVGRKKPLEKLHKNLQNNQATLLLNGLGGIGKTSLAQKYCYKHKTEYNHFVWINQTDTFENACLTAITLQRNLEIQPTDNIEQTIRLIFEKLNHIKGNNLLVLDNADESLKPYVKWLPPTWTILITSREKIAGDFIKQPLGVLNFEEAKDLFKQYYTESFTDAELEALCQEVGFHTLTLELLAKTLTENIDIDNIAALTTYLKEHRLDAVDLQEEVFTKHSDEEVEIYTHLRNAFTLATLNEDDKWLLLQFAVMPPIPHDAKDFRTWLQTDNHQLFKKTLQKLHKKGWLEKENKKISMHRMIQTLIRYQVPPTYENCKGLVDSFRTLLHLDQTKDNPINKFQWLEYGVTLCGRIQENTEQLGRLNNWTASAFEDIGNYKQAEKYYLQAIAIAEAMQDQTNVNAYNNNLANVYLEFGQIFRSGEFIGSCLTI